MTQFFKGDDLELKFYGAGEKAFINLRNTLADWFENAYTDQQFGSVLYDNNVTPLTGVIPRDVFIKNFNQIFENWQYVGSFESYLYVFKHIFGENSSVTFSKISPAHLKLIIVADNTTLFNWAVTTAEEEDILVTSDSYDEIVFQEQLGITDFRSRF